MINLCTIVARNYLPSARVLTESFQRHDADSSVTVLVIDDERREHDDRSEPFRVMRLHELGLDRREIGRLAGIYDVTELATAVKPVFLKTLLAEGRDHVIYLDPDIKIFGSMQEVADLARAHAIVLTPHTMVPLPRDGRCVEAANILASGVFNLGFLAISHDTRDLLEWWWAQTRRDALSDIERMMFTDQRCMDFVPCFFEHFVLRDPAYNVAYWNLHARELAWADAGYTVNGQPLRFFHFSGFDPRKPFLLSKHQLDRPRILLSDRPAVRRICTEYVDDLRRCGWPDSGRDYGWAALPAGVPLSPRIRRLYRDALVGSEKNGTPEPPNPFEPDRPNDFVDWLNEPIEPVMRPVVSRFVHSIYRQRPDLRAAFPDLAGRDASRLLKWVLRDGIRQEPLPEVLLPTQATLACAAERAFAPASDLTPGVNIVGYFRTITGVGEHARLLGLSLQAADIPHSTLTIGGTLSSENQEHIDRGQRRAPHDVNLLCVNADQTVRLASEFGPSFFEGRHTIGYWAWELERLPESMHPAFNVVDEVWGASRFVTEAVSRANRKPSFTVPYPLVAPRHRESTGRGAYGLPDRFMFLFMFDFLSVFERKNPMGLLDAFDRAFTAREEPFLVIKTINGTKQLNELERLRARVDNLPNVLLLEDYFTAEQKNGLLALCDCYVSLHRSEGTGITMGEAMALGKPVIATGYSGNLEFMTERNSYLVNYVKVPVPDGCEPYPRGYLWADPVVDHAADCMRRVFERRSEAAARAAQGQNDILTNYSAEKCAVAITRRLDDIRRSRRHAQTRPVRSGPAAAIGADTTLAASDALQQARDLLTPQPSLPATAKLRSHRLRLQRLLFRALRPYWWGQRQAVNLIIDAAAQTSSQSEEVLRQMAGLQSRLEDESSSRVQMLDAEIQTLREAVSESRSSSAAKLQTLESQIQSRMNVFSESVAGFQHNAAAHLAALTEGVSRLEHQGQDVLNRLYPIPYMSDPSLFTYVDTKGQKVLGFRDAGTGRGRYLGFEDIFRGGERFIRDRCRVYVPLVAGLEPVLDLGCGRGELLEVLREAQVTATGVDSDEDMVRHCQAKALDVVRSEAIEYLQAQPDSSLGAIVALQVIEHLTHDDTLAIFDLAIGKLKPGGVLIAETVNPHSLEALKGFWVDLTHRHPIFPEVAVALCWLRGFETAHVFFPGGRGDFESDRRTEGEYAVVARKEGGRSPDTKN
jgi:glycosyltransferase involved in cell wall biosynthesis/SAM-dependent methyltransferase